MNLTTQMSDVDPRRQNRNDKVFLEADVLCFIGYGIDISLFFLGLVLLRKRSKREKRKTGKRSWQTSILEVYNCLVFILCTLSVAAKIQMMKTSYVDDRDSTGGPGANQMRLYTSAPVGILGNIACAVANWLVDGLLLWRCYVVYRNSKTSLWLLLLIPATLGLGSVVISIIFLHAIAVKRATPFHDMTLTILEGASCLVLNVVLTFMIVMRLFLYRRSIMHLVGAEYAGQYTSFLSMLVESGLIMDVTVVCIVILVSVGSPMVALPLLSLTEVQAIAAFMIIIRVAKGTAWSSETANELIAQHAISTRGSWDRSKTGSVVSPFRITTQMTQMSAAFHFNHHAHSLSTTAGLTLEQRSPQEKMGNDGYRDYLSSGLQNMRAGGGKSRQRSDPEEEGSCFA